MQHAARMKALAGSIETPLLVTQLPNIRYLIGFTGSNGYLLAKPGGGAGCPGLKARRGGLSDTCNPETRQTRDLPLKGPRGP